ncbi:hypothetical protein DFH08DRAFT_934616 [Mycena albidolilacea]|uniref:Uncharacterized protein n=1 Tax=Mycena albidolilacea TaxID=1033008 RepID=A0AAD7A8I8_9AGAR|nr:hypothetical protein DFH08DRAFT_934616 [Mycena albidolilacea]
MCDQIPINRLQTLVWFYISVFETFYDTLDVLHPSKTAVTDGTGGSRPSRGPQVPSDGTGIPVPSRKTAVFVTAVPFNGRVEALTQAEETSKLEHAVRSKKNTFDSPYTKLAVEHVQLTACLATPMFERRGRKVNNVQPHLITNKTARRQVVVLDAARASRGQYRHFSLSPRGPSLVVNGSPILYEQERPIAVAGGAGHKRQRRAHSFSYDAPQASMDPLTATTTVITLATFIVDLIEMGQSIKRSIEKVRARVVDDILDTLAAISNLSRGHEDEFQVPALLSALVNLKAQVFLAIFEPFVLTHLLFRNMLYVLSLCRAICEAQPSRRRLGFGSQLKAWIKRDEIEAKVKGLKEHVNKCYLQFTVFSSARIEQTTARIEDTSHRVVNTTLRVEQSLLVNHVENQVKLKRLEGLMSQVLLEAQFGQGVTKGTMEKLKSQFVRFATPELKWRGYTLDAAKWTFSSDQLQGIVSRAIRQSADASFIRVLRPETVDSDIPNELHRLEMQRTDIKTQYEMLTRKRANFFDKLTSLLDGTEDADSAYALRVAENLKGICTDLDRLAEDLHSADEQIAQLKSVQDVHSASALAMALRKLNASFLKQIAEAEGVRTQMESLEAERDEAWSHAEAITVEYDNLAEQMDNSSGPRGSSWHAQSARIFIVGESNIRVSTASSTRRSSFSTLSVLIENIRQDSSTSPQHQVERMSTEIIGDTYSHRPEDTRVNSPSQAYALSTTPTSESGGLDQVHNEVHNMLGTGVPGRNLCPIIMSTAGDTEPSYLSSLAASVGHSNTSYSSFLPGKSFVYNAKEPRWHFGCCPHNVKKCEKAEWCWVELE